MAKNDEKYALLLLLLGGAGVYFLTRDKGKKIVTGGSDNTDNQIPPVVGCTDTEAVNYDSLAEVNDGSCVYNELDVVQGCTDSTASNFDQDANTDDGSCQYPIEGCTDLTAFNYNASAEVDDGSCEYYVFGCTNPSALNYNPEATINDGSCVAVVEGCTDPEADNYVEYANTDDNSCVFTTPIGGCMEPEACNYDPSATFQSGQCNYPYTGYDCDGNCIDTDADGVCNFDEVLGCTDSFSINFNPLATDDDGSCVATVEGCTDINATNYNASANFDNGSCTYLQGGCTNPNAVNYDSGADFNDGSCEFPFDVESTSDEFFDYVIDELGTDDCLPENWVDELSNWTDNNEDIFDGLGVTVNEGYNLMLEYIPQNYPLCTVAGCTNINATNYNPNATIDNGTCQYPQGCTDPSAENYDSSALQDDGSCDYISYEDEDFMNYWLLELAGTTNVSELDAYDLEAFAFFFGPENIVDNNGDVVTGVNYPQIYGISDLENSSVEDVAQFCVQTGVSSTYGNPTYGNCYWGTSYNLYIDGFLQEWYEGGNPENPYAPNYVAIDTGTGSSGN
jgi:hypothetical protein